MTVAKSPYAVPVAILLAGAVLSIAIYMVRTSGTAPAPQGDLSLMTPVGEGDHILGNPDAPVMLVEYSDLDCEYCKRSREVMEQIVAEYGADGKVAWTFRHFPIVDLHPDSGTHAEAAECVVSLGGPELFWRFAGALAAQAPGASTFDPQGYGAVAESLGVDEGALSACLAEGRFEARVARDFENALVIGADAAPFFVVLIEGASPITVSGYLPYDQMKSLVERALTEHAASANPQ
jgi:protein-disulfide isomerase